MLWDVAVQYGEDWLDPALDPLRCLLREWYFELFESTSDFYERLKASILKEGILNPIVVTAGPSLNRPEWIVPKDYGKYICESVGGSRLRVAQELGLSIPCIINDQIGVSGELLKDKGQVLSKFEDKSYCVQFGPPVKVDPTRYVHMPEAHTITVQQEFRRKTKPEIIRRAEEWRSENWGI